MPELNLLKNTSTKIIKNKNKTYIKGEMTAEYDQHKNEDDNKNSNIDKNFPHNSSMK